MTRSTTTASPLYPKIRFACTDHPTTVWAGAILLRLYFELIGLRAVLQRTLLPLAKRSNNQISTPDVLLAWFYGLPLGAERFAHFTRLLFIRGILLHFHKASFSRKRHPC